MMFDLLLLFTAFAAILLFLRWREPHMLYYPDRDLEATPDQIGLNYDDVTLVASDGVKINGWLVHGVHAVVAPVSGALSVAAGTAATTKSPVTVLFFHGNAGNISHRLDKLQILAGLGADIFIIDYRGYGRSEGSPNEIGTYRDAEAAYEYVTKRVAGEPRAALAARGAAMSSRGNPSAVVVYGESLGSAIAVDLATKHPVGGVIIEEAFTSIGDVGQKMFPFLPVRWLVRNKYDTLSKIGRINAPLLMFHSREDEFFNIRHAQRLLAAAKEPKQLVELHGDHNDAFAVSAETYRNALRAFLDHLRGT
ncbi:MAG TPA: alpha/beta hydrolase [Verrucomicrobiae bacterium]|nr:alpha/beta hydrolase [Verrucomicrobiae bacterium]